MIPVLHHNYAEEVGLRYVLDHLFSLNSRCYKEKKYAD